MRAVPRAVHREVLRRPDKLGGQADPETYALWLGKPHAPDAILLGRAERLPRGRWWRVFPATGEFPQSVRLMNAVIVWLLEVHDGHEATTDCVTATEDEKVTEL